MTAEPHTLEAGASASDVANRVCHEEQLAVWASEVANRLALGEYLGACLDYEDALNLDRDLKDEIRRIVSRAFEHPEAAALALAPTHREAKASGSDAVTIRAKIAADIKEVRDEMRSRGVSATDGAVTLGCIVAKHEAEILAALATPSSVQAGEAVSAPAGAGAVPEGWQTMERAPVGEVKTVLLSAAPATPEPAAGGRSWPEHSSQEIVRRTRCMADETRDAAVWRDCCDLILERLGAESRSTLSASTADGETAGVPEGWQLVPKRATPEMIHVMRYGAHDAKLIAIGQKPEPGETPWPRFGEPLAQGAYQAALAVAPTPTRPDATAEDATPAEGR